MKWASWRRSSGSEWTQAEQHYQQALQIKIEYNDRYSQAGIYHQLGTVAQEQGQWQAAYDYFLRALVIFVEFQEEYSLGIVRGSLRRLWQAHPEEAVLRQLAAMLGEEEAAVRAWLT